MISTRGSTCQVLTAGREEPVGLSPAHPLKEGGEGMCYPSVTLEHMVIKLKLSFGNCLLLF